MITNNYWAIEALRATWDNKTTYDLTFPQGMKVVSSLGTEYTGTLSFGNTTNIPVFLAGKAPSVSSSVGTHYPTVIIGSGDTEPTADDYELDSPISETLTQSYQVVKGQGGAGYDIVFTITGTNTSGSAYTIKEVGVNAFMGGTEDTYSFGWAMIARFLLETPITVAAGDGFSFAFRWSEA